MFLDKFNIEKFLRIRMKLMKNIVMIETGDILGSASRI